MKIRIIHLHRILEVHAPLTALGRLGPEICLGMSEILRRVLLKLGMDHLRCEILVLGALPLHISAVVLVVIGADVSEVDVAMPGWSGLLWSMHLNLVGL